jgi:hypothetical protein
MSDNVKMPSNKTHDYVSSQIDHYERTFQRIIDDAALDLSDVQVNAVMEFAFELFRERSEFSEKHMHALETCRETPDQYPSAETLESWVKQLSTRAHDWLRGLRDDGIEFDDKWVQEALDLGFRLLKLYDDHEAGVLRHILVTVLGEDAVDSPRFKNADESTKPDG